MNKNIEKLNEEEKKDESMSERKKMKPVCSVCGKEIEKAGGLVFSPPIGVDGNYPVIKFHICRECWKDKILPLVEIEKDTNRFKKIPFYKREEEDILKK